MDGPNSSPRLEVKLADLKRLVYGDLSETEYEELFGKSSQTPTPLRQVFDEMRRQSALLLGIDLERQSSHDERPARKPAR